MADNANIDFETTHPRVVTTQPKQILRHSISDEELEMLYDSRSDFVSEFIWIGIGGVVGAAPSALPSLINYASAEHALPASDMINLIVFFMSIAVLIVSCVVSHKRGSRSTNLRATIRARTKGGDTDVPLEPGSKGKD